MPKIGEIDVSMETLMGLDTDRKWVTGAQAFINSDFSMLIFRETLLAQNADNPTETANLIKNVASLVMPTDVLRELSRILAESFAEKEAPGSAD